MSSTDNPTLTSAPSDSSSSNVCDSSSDTSSSTDTSSSDASSSDSTSTDASLSSSASTAASAWPDAAPGGWNASIRTVEGLRRVPIPNLTTLNRDPAAMPQAEGSAAQRAVAYVPDGLDTSGAVEILVHLHGHNIGSRQRTASTSAPGTVRDVAVDAIAQQVVAGERPMIVLLPQGTASSGFGPTGFASFDITAFIDEALQALVTSGVLVAKPAVGGVILSGHSGGGGALSVLLSQSGTPNIPPSFEAEFLFEAINGTNELAAQTAYLTAKLNADLAAINAAADDAAVTAYLASSFRFAGFFNSDFYVPFYTALRKSLDTWFAGHAAALGGADSGAYGKLRANYAITVPKPANPHDEQVDHGNLLAALAMLG